MKKEDVKKVESEILLKKKMPQELKEKSNTIAFRNILMAIIIVIYFIFLNLGSTNIAKDVFIKDTNVFSIAILVITIILFEKAYKKDSGELCIYGIETLVLALITLFAPYIYFYIVPQFSKVIIILIPLAFCIYYLSKVAVICAKIKTNHEKTISDVKDIIKKEKRKIEDEDNDKVENKQEKPVKKTGKEVKKVRENKPKEKITTKSSKKAEKEEPVKTKKTTTTRKKKVEEGNK